MLASQSQDTKQATKKPRRRTHKERTDLSDSKMFEASEALILEVGTQKMTLKEVGERAGYSRGLANARFGNKETLFLKLSERCRDFWLDEVRQAADGKSGLAALLSRVDAVASYVKKYPNDAKVMYILWFESVGASSEMRDGLSAFHIRARKDVARLIEEAKNLGEIAKDINSEQLALHFTSTMFGLSYQFVVRPSAIDFDSFLSELKPQWLALLKPEKDINL